jgi:ribose 5-phosphate isomerase A
MAPPRATGRKRPPPLSDAEAIANRDADASAQPDAGATARDDAKTIAQHKRAVADAAAEMVTDGMRLGLGTGSTVAHLLPALAARGLRELRCVATSPSTEQLARGLGLALCELDDVGELDLAIDGADQIDPHGWLIKGGGAAHTREKIVAAAARRFVVIASAEKVVPALQPPVPLELVRFGVSSTLRELGQASLREGASASPDGGLIADYEGPIGDPRALAARLSALPGVVEHGLFAPEMVDLVLIAGAAGIERRAGARG